MRTANSFADVAYFRAFHVTRYPQIKWIRHREPTQ
jgi:hypothetical protein